MSVFHRAQYKIIAEAIADSDKGNNMLDKQHLVSLLCYWFKLDNSRFNLDKFKEVCYKNH